MRCVTNSCLGDLAVGVASGGEGGDAALGGRERVATRERRAARPRPGVSQLRAGARGDPDGAGAVGEVERPAQRRARRLVAAAPAQGGAQVAQRVHVLELGRAGREQRHRALERRERGRAGRAQGDRAQRGAERAGRAEALGQRELLAGERRRVAPLAERRPAPRPRTGARC